MSRKQIVDDYEDILGGTNKSESTVQTYVSHVVSFLDWFEESREKDVGAVLESTTERDIKAHLGSINSELAGKTVKTRLYAIRSFFDQMADEDPTGDIDQSEYGGTKPERRKGGPESDEHTYLSKEEVAEMADLANGTPVRDPLIIRLLFETGMRVGELSRALLEYVDLEKQEMRIESLKKEEEEWRTVYWHTDKTDRLMRLWINKHRPALWNADNSPYVFPTQGRERIREQLVNEIVKDAAESAGLQEVIGQDAAGRDQYKITAHVLRHSSARHLLDDIGMDVVDVKKIMGHSAIEITDHYAEGTSEDIREKLRTNAAATDSDF